MLRLLALVHSVPGPVTSTELERALEARPMLARSVMTAAPAAMIARLFVPNKPTSRPLVVTREPLPWATKRLLIALELPAPTVITPGDKRAAPLLTINWLSCPLKPTRMPPVLLQTVLAPLTIKLPVRPAALPRSTAPMTVLSPPSAFQVPVWPAVRPIAKLPVPGATMLTLLTVVSMPKLKLKTEFVKPGPLLVTMSVLVMIVPPLKSSWPRPAAPMFREVIGKGNGPPRRLPLARVTTLFEPPIAELITSESVWTVPPLLRMSWLPEPPAPTSNAPVLVHFAWGSSNTTRLLAAPLNAPMVAPELVSVPPTVKVS